MEFKNKFKRGDIICSDTFINGKCLIVKHFENAHSFSNWYSCDDLILPNQTWSAHEYQTSTMKPYDFRLATDEDICRYIDKFITIEIGKLSSGHKIFYTHDGLKIENTSIFFSTEELIDFQKIINPWFQK